MNNKVGGSLNTCVDPRCHIGETHGVFTLVDVLEEKDKYGHYVYKGVCNECGYIKSASYGNFCGNKTAYLCKHVRAGGFAIERREKWSNTRLQHIFKDMIARCYNSNNKSYKWYGGKGIRICDDWMRNPMLFKQWAMQNGYTDTMTIDRLNPDIDYCPENCRWIPSEENSRRSGNVNWICISNTTLTGRQWSEKLGLGCCSVNKFIQKCGIDKTIELIRAMLIDPPNTKHRKSRQTWFDVYGIQV